MVGKKAFGKLFLESKAWEKAFVHIAEHFSFTELARKAVHTFFVDALRSTTASKPFIKETLLKPTRKIISRRTTCGYIRARSHGRGSRGQVHGQIRVRQKKDAAFLRGPSYCHQVRLAP